MIIFFSIMMSTTQNIGDELIRHGFTPKWYDANYEKGIFTCSETKVLIDKVDDRVYLELVVGILGECHRPEFTKYVVKRAFISNNKSYYPFSVRTRKDKHWIVLVDFIKPIFYYPGWGAYTVAKMLCETTKYPLRVGDTVFRPEIKIQEIRFKQKKYLCGCVYDPVRHKAIFYKKNDRLNYRGRIRIAMDQHHLIVSRNRVGYQETVSPGFNWKEFKVRAKKVLNF